MGKIAIAIHGGAGTILKSLMTNVKEANYRNALSEALKAGHKVLKKGGSALDAVEAAVILLENNPLFNAGRGSVLTYDQENEMDASIMDGKNLEAGAVAGIKNIKNPVSLAKRVMTHSKHVLLAGQGAKQFASDQGFEHTADEYFFSEHRLKQLKRAKKADEVILDHSDDRKYGTVGAVALDENGNLAAATSTGGLTNKRYGRIGDSPIIGSGTYANNTTCAVSCTGDGEFFLRSVVAYDVSCLMEYKGSSLKDACDTVINQKLAKIKGDGGLIAIDSHGNVEMTFNCPGMFRASQVDDDTPYIGIFR